MMFRGCFHFRSEKNMKKIKYKIRLAKIEDEKESLVIPGRKIPILKFDLTK